AGLMTALALAFAPRDGADKTRVAGFTLAALGLIAFALSLVLTETALTLAFAAVTLAAALLDRKFDLRPLSVAVQIGAIGLAWRLIFDPGLGWAETAPYWELALAYGGSVAALVATVGALRPRVRPAALVVAESAAWTLGAVFVNVLIARAIQDAAPGVGVQNHWAMSLMGMVWLVSAANQLWRTQLGGKLAKLRWGLAGLYAAGGALYLALALGPENPLFVYGRETGVVLGPPFVNTLAVAYLIPALFFGFLARRFGFLDRRLRLGFALVSAALGALWLFLAIRDFWRGDEIASADFSQPELYTYTMVLLLIGAGLLWQAIAKRSATLRKIGMGVIAVTIAKVFLVDMSGLVGLLRVFSFLALGLALAGLAFLNRWAASHTGEAERGGE
ncbi:MAG: DUF2339 domain-containing protein, partial [Maritimibacter sp.]|nr:DUF2339 domain-containing protein [Maritimibacter sp.]